MVLGEYELIAFTQTSQPENAKAFYCGTLGLELKEENAFALVVQAGRTMLRIQKVKEFSPLPFTSLGWKVPDLRSVMLQFVAAGVRFTRYEGMQQDELGVWVSPSGAKVCWFKDPDGNNLSLTQFS